MQAERAENTQLLVPVPWIEGGGCLPKPGKFGAGCATFSAALTGSVHEVLGRARHFGLKPPPRTAFCFRRVRPA
eukprot:14518666-Alexandrium_andersonii.AAC.1